MTIKAPNDIDHAREARGERGDYTPSELMLLAQNSVWIWNDFST